MHARVGPARAVQKNLFLRQPLQHVDDFPLNSRLIPLHLPAVEIRPIVGNGEFEMAHIRRLPTALNISEWVIAVSQRCVI